MMNTLKDERQAGVTGVDILIATHNRADSLRYTLKSLACTSLPADVSVVLWLLDNASTDHTHQICESFTWPGVSVQYLSLPRPGKAAALNEGLRKSSGDLLLFCDDDVRVPDDWIISMLEPFDDSRVAAVMGGVRIASQLKRDWFEPEHRRMLAEVSEELYGEKPHFVGANMAARRSVLEEIGGFEEALGPGALGLGEDSLLGDQILEYGYTIAPRFNVVVEHHFSPDRLEKQSWLAHAEKNGRSTAYAAFHYHGSKIPYALFRSIIAAIRLCMAKARFSRFDVREGFPMALYRRQAARSFFKKFHELSRAGAHGKHSATIPGRVNS